MYNWNYFDHKKIDDHVYGTIKAAHRLMNLKNLILRLTQKILRIYQNILN